MKILTCNYCKREFVENRLNNVLSNLITLCRKCHPTIHSSWGLKVGWL